MKKPWPFLIVAGSCPTNSHIELNYNDCGVTCANRNTNPTSCTLTASGCVCDAGYFRDSVAGQCVRECNCGCFDSNNGYRAVILMFFSLARLHNYLDSS